MYTERLKKKLKKKILRKTSGVVGQKGGAESCSFSTDTENFRQKRLRTLRILVVLLSVPKMTGFQLHIFLHF